MKLYSFDEVQLLRNDGNQGWSERAIEDGFIFIPQINRFVKPEPKEDYYGKGKTMNDFYISSSALQYINPEEGGSPRAFVNFIEKGIEESKSMRLGTLLHRYHEDRDSFKISNVLKPSEKAGEVADKIIEIVKAGHIYCTETIALAIAEIGYQANWKPETRINKIIELCGEYVSEVLEATENNQIYLTASEVEPIEKGSEALDSHPVASKIAFFSNDEISGKICFKEAEFDWSTIVNIEIAGEAIKVPVKLKSKVDNIIIDTEKKEILITDLKSSINGGYSYQSSDRVKARHYRQLAFYLLQVKNWLKENNFDTTGYIYKFKIISLQTSGLYECVVYDIDSRLVTGAIEGLKEIFKRIAYHKHLNQWNYSKEEMENNFEIKVEYVEDTQSQNNGGSTNS